MTQSEHTTRTRRAQTLVDLVEKVQGGYRVRSARDPDVAYFVSKPNGQIICTCSDFEKHFAEDPRWECKHILAAWEAHRLGKLNRDGRDLSAGQPGRAPEAITTEDLSTEKETAVTGLPEEEITPLESCGRCGRTFPADELVPTNGADGSSLLCWECLETSAATTEEPPFTYPAGKADAETIPAQSPCGRCGRFLPLARLEGEVCLECLSEEQAREGSGFKVHGSEVKTLNREPLNLEPYSLQPSSLAEKVAMANEILASWGVVAIDTDQKGYTGYGFQYVIDAVNSALDPEGWRYELLTHQVEKSGDKTHKAFVLLQLHLRLANGSWFTKGSQFGGSQNTDPTDALKGALSDGLKKAFSHWGVGNIAYRGELKKAEGR